MVFEAMKRAMEESMKLIHAGYVADLFKNLLKLRIGTTRIDGLARKVCNNLSQQKVNTLTATVVRWKLQDANRCLRKAKYNNMQAWRREKPLLDQENVTTEYEFLWSREKSTYTNELRRKLRQKLSFLRNKLKKDAEGITIADQLFNGYKTG